MSRRSTDDDDQTHHRSHISQEWVSLHLGLICDQCGENRWWVTHTWRRGGKLVRRRTCRSCQHVIYTTEQIDS